MLKKAKNNPNHKNELTRERILDEAETLFANNGYHAVSVREITTAAQCNPAAANYHFGNKRGLYLEVFRSRWVPRAKRLHQCFREYLAGDFPRSPVTVVQTLARAYLSGPLSDEECRRHHQLMSRELGRPSEAFELVVEQVMRPFSRELVNLLRPFMPEGLGEERLVLNTLSVLAIVLYFNLAPVAVTRITGCEYDRAFKDRLVEHIARFSVEGLHRDKKEALQGL